MTLEEAIDRFQGQQRGSGWIAHCPAHEDTHASLSIAAGDDGRILLHCHAGCPLEAVLGAVGLTMMELFSESKTRTNGSIVAEYRYCDETGEPLYDVVRFTPKDFRQRRADGRWNMTGVRRVLYRLPELQGKVSVYTAEGEKDVERLCALGLSATTSVGGAGKWREDYTQQLVAAKVKQVVVLPDNDDAGRAHAEDVARSCHAVGLQVKVVTLPALAPKGDVSDWLTAGNDLRDLTALVNATTFYAPPPAPVVTPGGRVVHLTKASSIQVRPVRWLWQNRMPLGALTLVGGREGTGKSLTVYTLGADITRGRLVGVLEGTPRAIVVAATEDSWSHTIVPRLMAAGADLDLVYRVDVTTSESIATALSLPRDLVAFEQTVAQVGATFVILDPLLSRLDGTLDSHKDADVRRALEPLVAVAERTGISIAGLIHVNKSSSDDPLTSLMASRAFAAVARTVLFVMADPDNEGTRMLGVVKTNVGRLDLPTLSFTVVSTMVAETSEGQVWTGKLEWIGNSDRSIREALQATTELAKCDPTAVGEAADWLEDFLKSKGGSAPSSEIKKEAKREQHSEAALHRARKRLGIVSVSCGFPRSTSWMLPSVASESSKSVGESETSETTGTTEAAGSQSCQSSQSYQSNRPHQTTARNVAANANEDSDDGYF